MIKVSDLSSCELEQIIKMDQEYLKYAWKREQWDEFTERNAENLYLSYIEKDGEILSYGLFEHLVFENALYLLKIITKVDKRSEGLASKVLQIAEHWCDPSSKILLEVAHDNLSAIQLYKSSGFETLRLVKGFYSDGADALSMVRYIS